MIVHNWATHQKLFDTDSITDVGTCALVREEPIAPYD
jgi:hypothetical protein